MWNDREIKSTEESCEMKLKFMEKTRKFIEVNNLLNNTNQETVSLHSKIFNNVFYK